MEEEEEEDEMPILFMETLPHNFACHDDFAALAALDQDEEKEEVVSGPVRTSKAKKRKEQRKNPMYTNPRKETTVGELQLFMALSHV